MFCQKCGFNAGTAKFCPKCGNMLVKPETQATPVTPATPTVPEQATPVTPEAQATPVTPEVQAAPEQATPVTPESPAMAEGQIQNNTYSASGQGTIPNEYGMNNGAMPAGNMQYGAQMMGQNYGNVAPQQQQAKKKKKKWPLVLGIVLAVLIIGGAAGALVWNFVIKDKDNAAGNQDVVVEVSANDAVKNAGTGLETYMNNALSSGVFSSVKEKSKVTGSYTLDSAEVADQDLMSMLGVDTVNYTIENDITKGESAFTFGFAKGKGSNVITCKVYSDGENIYFSIPELFTESFVIPMSEITAELDDDAAQYYNMLMAYASNLDSSVLEQYNDEIKAGVAVIVKGINTFADSCEYTKLNSYNYQSENGDINVTEFNVKLTKEAVINSINTVIDAAFEDENLSVYMNLITSFAGVDKDSLKSSIADEMEDFAPVTVTMLVDDSNSIVKLSLDVSQFDPSEEGNISLEFLGGKDSPFSYFVATVVADDITMKVVVKTNDNKTDIAFEIKPDQNEYPGEFFSMGMTTSVSGNTSNIEELYVKGNLGEDVKLDISMSATATVDDITSVSMSKSDFKDAIDISDSANLTDALLTNMLKELEQNKDVIKKLVSSDIYDLYLKSVVESGAALPDASMELTPVDIQSTVNPIL
ncbi:MAG: hypothetical protein ACI4E1_06090 [Lachnospira sp.]